MVQRTSTQQVLLLMLVTAQCLAGEIWGRPFVEYAILETTINREGIGRLFDTAKLTVRQSHRFITCLSAFKSVYSSEDGADLESRPYKGKPHKK